MGMGVFTRTATWTLGGQAGMSMQGDSPEYEYRGDCRSTKCGAIGFHAWWCAAPAAHVSLILILFSVFHKPYRSEE